MVYVDDTKPKAIVNDEHDVESLQNDLNKIYTWQESNNMKFNGKKFQVLRYGKKKT